MSDNPIKEDETQLIGIDFNDFGNNSSNENVNSSKDDPIIKEISVHLILLLWKIVIIKII